MSRTSQATATKPARKYSRALCDEVRNFGRIGLSRSEIAVELDISEAVLTSWINRHPEFAQAMDAAYYFALGWWERLGRVGMLRGARFNALEYIRQMTARFPNEYQVTADIELSIAAAEADRDWPRRRRSSRYDA